MIKTSPTYIALMAGETAPLANYSYAIDEIYQLRALLADEAAIIEAHLDLKTFPKSRREIAEKQIERMRAAARGETPEYRDRWSPSRALKSAGADDGLLNWQWEMQRGLRDVAP